jgi:alkylation response protein AidB-like acyl-CoA dehydrogenase
LSAVAAAAALFSNGLAGPDVDQFDARMAELLAEHVAPALEAAEREHVFPRGVLSDLGDSGIFRERWRGGPHGDPGKAMILAEQVGRLGYGGVALGISIHAEAVLGMLLRFGAGDALREYTDAALDGRLVGALALSEATAGSDLLGVRTLATREDGAWRVRGTKSYVSLASVADFVIALCRLESAGQAPDHGSTAPLMTVLVPREGFTVDAVLDTVGLRSLDTARLTIDARVPDELVLGSPGAGLLSTEWGLTCERLAVAAGLCGMCDLALSLSTVHLHRRQQFGVPLIRHQALRLRLAELSSRVFVTRLAVRATAALRAVPGAAGAREVAAVKVQAARTAETVMSESMQFFGGLGYVEGATPIARLWRDARLARIGGGSDEMMLELVAGGMEPTEAAELGYERMVETQA